MKPSSGNSVSNLHMADSTPFGGIGFSD
jgi:hypothetical protein